MDEPIDLLKLKIEQAKAKLPPETLDAISAVDWHTVILGMREKRGYSFEQLGDLETETELLLCGLVSPEEYPKELARRMGISKAQVDELVNEMNDLVFKKIKEELIKNTERKKIFNKSERMPERIPMADAPIPLNIQVAQLHPSDHKILETAGIEIIGKPTPHPDPLLVKPASLERSGGEREDKLPITGKLELPAKPIISAMAQDRGWEKPKVAPAPAASVASAEKPKEVVQPIHPILAQKLSGYVQSEVKETDHSLKNIASSSSATQSGVTTKPTADPYREIPE